jgi:hypothetical protein
MVIFVECIGVVRDELDIHQSAAVRGYVDTFCVNSFPGPRQEGLGLKILMVCVLGWTNLACGKKNEASPRGFVILSWPCHCASIVDIPWILQIESRTDCINGAFERSIVMQ